MKSRVTGEIPPKSLIPARNNSATDDGFKFGGDCTLTSSSRMSRASATACATSGSGGSGLSTREARKFCTITS